MTTRAFLPAGQFAVLSDGERKWVCASDVTAAEITEDRVLGVLSSEARRRRFTPKPTIDIEFEYLTSGPRPEFEKCRSEGTLVWPYAGDTAITMTDWDGLGTSELAALESEESARVEAVVMHLAGCLSARPRIFEMGLSHGLLLRRLHRAIDDVQLAGCDPSPTMLQYAINSSTPGWLIKGDHKSVGTIATRCHAMVSRALSAGVMTRQDALIAVDLMRSALLPGGWLLLTSRHPPLINPSDLISRGFAMHATMRRSPGGRWAPFLAARRMA